MQERVVYFLGAGFSQPRGLPVISDFINKARMRYNEDRELYQHFEEVLKMTEIAIAKHYFKTDLGDIEEILSILDMRAQLEDNPHLEESVRKCIADVILAYTPKIKPVQQVKSRGDWEEYIFGEDSIWKDYGQFVASLHNLTIGMYVKGGHPYLGWQRVSNPETRYDVISLNYDCVLETVCDFLNAHYQAECPLRFQRTESDKPATELGLPWLAKLHGSVDKPDDIIPPTWSKTLDKAIKEQWRIAHRLLLEADHIRILGYSLPISDTYVKYLFISAVIQAEHELRRGLQSFDVITYDPAGKAQERYKEFVPLCQFVNAKIEEYFQRIKPKKERSSTTRGVELQFITLEDAHSEFMQEYVTQS